MSTTMLHYAHYAILHYEHHAMLSDTMLYYVHYDMLHYVHYAMLCYAILWTVPHYVHICALRCATACYEQVTWSRLSSASPGHAMLRNDQTRLRCAMRRGAARCGAVRCDAMLVKACHATQYNATRTPSYPTRYATTCPAGEPPGPADQSAAAELLRIADALNAEASAECRVAQAPPSSLHPPRPVTSPRCLDHPPL